jgi:hypothetical protein
MAHALLLTRAELPAYGIPRSLLAQFDVRPIQVTADTVGALGTATFKWRFLGDSDWSAVRASSPTGPWSWEPDGDGSGESHATVTFTAGTYTSTAVYTIDEAGTVTRSGAGPDTVTAERVDAVAIESQSVSNEATDLCQPRYTLPLLAWGDAFKRNAANWIKWRLKGRVGMAAGDSALGDQNVIVEGQAAMLFFKRQGEGDKKSAEVTDSSSAGTGAGLMVRIASDDKAGWD